MQHCRPLGSPCDGGAVNHTVGSIGSFVCAREPQVRVEWRGREESIPWQVYRSQLSCHSGARVPARATVDCILRSNLDAREAGRRRRSIPGLHYAIRDCPTSKRHQCWTRESWIFRRISRIKKSYGERNVLSKPFCLCVCMFSQIDATTPRSRYSSIALCPVVFSLTPSNQTKAYPWHRLGNDL